MYINSLKESEKELHEILQMKENIAKYIGKRAQEENMFISLSILTQSNPIQLNN